MRMTFYKTDIKDVPQSGNFEFRVKGLPSLKKEPFKSNIIFATSSVNFQRKGQGPTLDKIFGSNFKRIKVPVQVPRGFHESAIRKKKKKKKLKTPEVISNKSSILEDDDDEESEFGIRELDNESEYQNQNKIRINERRNSKTKHITKREQRIKQKII